MSNHMKNIKKIVDNSTDDSILTRCACLPSESQTPCTAQSTPARNSSPFQLPFSGKISDRDEGTCFVFHAYSSTPDSTIDLAGLHPGSSSSSIEELRGSARIPYLNDSDEEAQGQVAALDHSSKSSMDEKLHSGWSETSGSWTVSSTKSSRTFDYVKKKHDANYHCDSSLSSSESNPIPGYEYKRALSTSGRKRRDEVPPNLGKPVVRVNARPLKVRPEESNVSMQELSQSFLFLLSSMHRKAVVVLMESCRGKRFPIQNLLLILLLYSATTFLLLINQIHSIPSTDLKELFQRQSMKRTFNSSIIDEVRSLEHHELLPTLDIFSEIQIKRSLGGIHSIHDANEDKAITQKVTRQALGFRTLDIAMYGDSHSRADGRPHRVVHLNENIPSTRSKRRIVEVDRTPFSDNTQLYPSLDSEDDEQLSKMEILRPEVVGDKCMSDSWQREYHPSCNNVHEFDLLHVDDAQSGGDLKLFKKEGYWRNAWKIELPSNESRNIRETYILKTPKYIHNFEQAYYETDRIDALAMSMLTFSPYVIDIYSFCGRTVLTEFAGGPSLGSIFDKARKHGLKRLEIARDLALGLSHVHYGKERNEDNALFTHFDINPANVVVTSKSTLRINDFNIAQMMKRNVTSGKQCTLPHHHFPNPQWRSPEEVNEFDHLSVKVDVFSLGHVFYRIIFGHEPWNTLEQGRKPSSDVLATKVRAGILPRMPQNVMESTDPVVTAIRKAMLMCYTVDPMKRPSSKALAAFLDEELKSLQAITM